VLAKLLRHSNFLVWALFAPRLFLLRTALHIRFPIPNSFLMLWMKMIWETGRDTQGNTWRVDIMTTGLDFVFERTYSYFSGMALFFLARHRRVHTTRAYIRTITFQAFIILQAALHGMEFVLRETEQHNSFPFLVRIILCGGPALQEQRQARRAGAALYCC